MDWKKALQYLLAKEQSLSQWDEAGKATDEAIWNLRASGGDKVLAEPRPSRIARALKEKSQYNERDEAGRMAAQLQDITQGAAPTEALSWNKALLGNEYSQFERLNNYLIPSLNALDEALQSKKITQEQYDMQWNLLKPLVDAYNKRQTGLIGKLKPILREQIKHLKGKREA